MQKRDDRDPAVAAQTPPVQAAALEDQSDDWRNHLARGATRLNLPSDRSRPPAGPLDHDRHATALPKPLAEALRALAAAETATLFEVLLAAVQTLLVRYTAQSELLVGVLNAEQADPETGAQLGRLRHMLACRANLDSTATFRDLLGLARTSISAAQAHPIPLTEWAEEQALDGAPPVDVLLVLHEAEPGSPSQLDLEKIAAHTALVVEINVAPDGLRMIWIYASALFEPTTIARMAGHFQTLLAAIVAHPDTRIAYLPLLTAAEQQHMLIDWNESAADYPRDAAVHQLIEAQAIRTPNRPAIVFEGASLTYSELNERANQLAHYLRSQGVGPDVLVALSVERGLEMIVGMLAILKAGGAYVPLDPAYPAERLHYMLAHSRAKVILTQAALVPKLPEHQATVFRLDADWETLAEQPTTNPKRMVLPQHLAYVIYTSGSTGRPKGVMVPQQGLINLVHGLRAYFTDPAVTTTGLITSISFDISVNQIFPTLIFGRTLHIIADAVKFDSQALFRYLDDHQIHLLDAVPSYLQAMLNEVAPDRLANALRYFIIGGEKLEARLLQSVFGQLGPDVAIVNIYGLTEISDINILGVIRAADVDQPITVGRPLQNNRIYIVDPHDQPQPVGIAGEVCVTGESVSRGYLFRPELTAERFVPCPFEDGAIMVRTGDLGRWRPDGTVEILGRIDHQVKIRGFRIELGEIEAVLQQHEAVRETAVIVREDRPGDKRLVAYVVEQRTGYPRAGEQRTKESEDAADTCSLFFVLCSDDLRQYVSDRLPDYMVPSAFVILDALPLNPSGKLDRKALPAPPLTERAFIAARSPLEEVLCGIWSQVLGVAQVGVFDNFLELGGHSLIATQIVARVRQVFNVDLPQRLLFEMPTVAQMAAQITAAQHSATTQETPPIQVVDRSQPLPQSFAQQRCWFLDQWEPGNPAYHIALALRIVGPLTVATLHHSLNTIIARHEVLRTTFTVVADQPVQRPLPELTIDLPMSDLASLPESERLRAAQRLAVTVARQSFDLVQGPLIRSHLLRLDTQTHELLLIIHHTIADGWSLGVLLHELTTIYDATAGGYQPDLPTLPIQYADYSAWQRQWLQDEVLAAQFDYWRQQLAGRPAYFELPSDQPRPTAQSFNGRLHGFTVPERIAADVRTLSRQEGVTLFMTLLAAFQTLLYRYTGQIDLVIGTPIAGRTRAEVEPLIGCFINTLVLRTDLSGNPSFRALLGRVREVALAAYAHQDLPFEQLVEALQTTRDVSRPPIVQIMFVLQSTPLEPVATKELRIEPVPIDTQTTNLDLILSMQDTAQGMTGQIEYNTDLFAPETIDRLAGHFLMLLAGIVADPTQRIGALPLLTAAEQEQRRAWNATAVATDLDGGVQMLFAAQAARTPDATATRFGDRSMSYAELNTRANQLAHHLRARGVGPDTCVGLCLERSLDLAVGVLGILKAGGCYVPLDPRYPAERLQFMLKDSQAAILLTQESLIAALPTASVQVICLDRDWPTIAQHRADDPRSNTRADHLAYILYTSGSTGRPKGVAVSHRAIGNRIAWSQQVDPLTAEDRVLQVASMSFDIALWELLGPLLAGATVVLAPPDAQQDPDVLLDLLVTEGITVAHLVPSLLNLLLTDSRLSRCRTLRSLYYGGEASATELPARIRSQLPVDLFHFYGPTEAAINATAWRYDAAAPTPVSIGRPISNMQVHLLDDQLQPVPVGVPGELYLGGVGLGRGYHNRPDLTAAAFMPDPFGPTSGSRLYKTGDLARYRPDGNIEFVGRIDHQVKLRGVRIELGEIEAALRQCPGVREAIVITREDTPGDPRLVAYVTEEQRHPEGTREQRTKEDQDSTENCSLSPARGYPVLCSPQELRQFLAARLPTAMLPSAFVVLDTLPLTPNGKVDRNALPAPDRTRSDLAKTLVAPRTPVEQVLAGIWGKVLKLERIGVDDNFFELGGHSLLATQVISRMRQIFKMPVPQRSIFEAQTIAELANYLIANEPKPGQVAKIAQLVQQVKRMSTDDKRDTLHHKRTD